MHNLILGVFFGWLLFSIHGTEELLLLALGLEVRMVDNLQVPASLVQELLLFLEMQLLACPDHLYHRLNQNPQVLRNDLFAL